MAVVLFLISSMAWAGFTRGSKFYYVSLEGELTVHCQNQIEFVSCREDFLEPWPYDHFEGPQHSHAETVLLQAQVGDNIRKATASYDGRRGKSSDVNLGIYALFQKPLLRVGTNKIQYFLLDKKDKVVDQGNFSVEVARLSARKCAHREILLPDVQGCSYTYSVCQQYFKSMNYCRP